MYSSQKHEASGPNFAEGVFAVRGFPVAAQGRRRSDSLSPSLSSMVGARRVGKGGEPHPEPVLIARVLQSNNPPRKRRSGAIVAGQRDNGGTKKIHRAL
jgi:hypothetical protein